MRGARAKSKLGVAGAPYCTAACHPSTQLPIGISDAIPKRAWKKKKAYGLADVAGLATAVITQKDLAVKEKLITTEVLTAQKQRQKMASCNPPARARRPASISHTFSDSESEEDTNLPSSAAPPRLDGPQQYEED